MIDFLSLLENTSAYKTVKGDKLNNTLSHAYLLVCNEEAFLKDYLKVFVNLILSNGVIDKNSREYKLIEENAHPDVYWYPEKDKILTEDINSLTSESIIKPLEADKKIFVLNGAQTMNASAQNKLLKTLEEPPKNVHIILGATLEHPLLSTVKSRVKKLTIPAFSESDIYSALKAEYGESEKLKTAVSCADGSLGRALSLYSSENLAKCMDLVSDILLNLNSSKNVLEYSVKITDSKLELKEIFIVLELAVRDMLADISGAGELAKNKEFLSVNKKAKGFNKASLICALEKITEANKRLAFNNNQVMLIEWLLFSILEGKFKWQKL